MHNHNTPNDHTSENRKQVETAFRKWGWMFPAVGFLSLLWVLIRIPSKPSRASYPCQKVAMPLAFSFLAWVGGAVLSMFAWKNMRAFRERSKWVMVGGCFILAFFGTYMAWQGIQDRDVHANVAPYQPTLAPNTHIGVPRGINPGRVVWAYDPAVTPWNGTTGKWWHEQNLKLDVVTTMVSNSLRALTGEPNDADAWDAMFKYFNNARGRGEIGYQAGEKIAIKTNLNVSGSYNWNGDNLITSPQMIRGLLRHLVNEADVPQNMITVYDASRIISDPIWNYCRQEFPNVRYVDREGENGRIKALPDLNVAVHHAEPLDDSGQIRLPTCVTAATYLINLGQMKGHVLAGVTFGAKNHYGSVWRQSEIGAWNKGWSPGNMHNTAAVTGWEDIARPMASYNPLVELMGHQHLDGKCLLWLVEAFHGTDNQNGGPIRWQSAPFNNSWMASLFISQDPVAIESVGLDFMRSEPAVAANIKGHIDNYLHEAALAHNPPSGSFYDPEGNGTRLASLGVHEVWNNAIDKQYSRNLGTDDGIELVKVFGAHQTAVQVNSTPAGVSITGSRPGTTPYTETYFAPDTVYFNAPSNHAANDVTWNFAYWKIDDESRQPGQTNIAVSTDENRTAEAVYQLRGDANGDGVINVLDLLFVRNRFGQPVTENDNWFADINQDNSIDTHDLQAIRNMLNKGN